MSSVPRPRISPWQYALVSLVTLEFEGVLKRRAKRLLRPTRLADPEDLVQEAITRLLTRLAIVECQWPSKIADALTGLIRAWLFRTMQLIALEWIRKQYRDENLVRKLLETHRESYHGGEEEVTVAEFLERLPTTLRSLADALLADWTPSEHAAVINRSVSTVSHRRKRLQERLVSEGFLLKS